MSNAFVKEGESEQLKDVTPNVASLMLYLKCEYRGSVSELHARLHPKHQKEVH